MSTHVAEKKKLASFGGESLMPEAREDDWLNGTRLARDLRKGGVAESVILVSEGGTTLN